MCGMQTGSMCNKNIVSRILTFLPRRLGREKHMAKMWNLHVQNFARFHDLVEATQPHSKIKMIEMKFFKHALVVK
ncbi:hypothetical protein BJF91_05310 [Allorhizobium taibaishanense]|uniref:Uncharacterized protein n=1 Tax=Allorhizobium taibaishanense TaxID=887144 RepID=A0A1Q8ZZQ6_9HYPH|nr:hypothetical protein [Allorhizobium taibaishanense]OLP47781.1 hypothetical protein BJF91_05310 [Allorhizobium taibaishanense]